MIVRHPSIALIALLVAGCGGGGSDDTAVSANPPAPAPVEAPGAAPAPAPGTSPAPSPGTSPAPAPGAGPAPGAAPGPASPSVSGPLVLAALQTGVSPDPAPDNPYSNNRKVVAPGGGYYFLGGALSSYTLSGGFPGGSGIGLWHRVDIEPIASGGVIVAVKANGLTLEGAPLDLRNVDPGIDANAATWSSGEWFATLLVQSVPARADLMRVCWNARLPPPPPVPGPPGYTPLTRTEPFKRLMCGVYNRDKAGPDVGGYLVDEFSGVVGTYSGAW